MNFKLIQQALVALEMYREYTPEGNGVAEQAIVALKQFKKEWQETEVPYVVVECSCSDKTTLYSSPQLKQEPVAKKVAECLAVLRPAVSGRFPHEQALEELVSYTHPQPKREPLTDEMREQMRFLGFDTLESRTPFVAGWLKAEAAHGIKE